MELFIITKTEVDTNDTEVIKVLNCRLEAINYLYEHVSLITDLNKEHTLMGDSMFEYTRFFGYLTRSKKLDCIYKIHRYALDNRLELMDVSSDDSNIDCNNMDV
jgi:hypothetical protein